MTKEPQWCQWMWAARDSLLYRDGRPVAMCASPELARELFAELSARHAVSLPLVQAERQRREDVVAELHLHLVAIERQRDMLQAKILATPEPTS